MGPVFLLEDLRVMWTRIVLGGGCVLDSVSRKTLKGHRVLKWSSLQGHRLDVLIMAQNLAGSPDGVPVCQVSRSAPALPVY